MIDLDPRDRLLQDLTPVIPLPRFGKALAALNVPGHRYLVAEDGLWIEVKRAWLSMRARIADAVDVALPFGRAADPEHNIQGTYAFSDDDLARLQTLFLHDARAALPDEFAAWGVWNERTRIIEYRPLVAIEASPGGITFSRPRLEDHEHLAVDLHSHGTMAPFFSATDDADDRGEVKISVVAGNLDTEPSFHTRLCLLGLFVDAE